ncbi:hypothetical protein THAOC_02992 [Thalassiosira oceanica]|uniref:Nudix hydrolase domain-containing protein n=1 Tax=Thalassiosira oceanica TaxID=159749 RepID=K0TDT7_THAOC|nr:hypothetical protein THAOC_02992 [Thalassiosira oceanica]|eukprot:EJK75289.1 hypothetical protein THAOC_02992 [Thalassiosira oceanica]
MQKQSKVWGGNSAAAAASLVERVKSLDRSSELKKQYTPIVIQPHVVGAAQNRLISTLLECNSTQHGGSVFFQDRIPNSRGEYVDVLRFTIDQAIVRGEEKTVDGHISNRSNEELLSCELDSLTDFLIRREIIADRHADLYPLRPLERLKDIDDERPTLALVNRNVAPYLGMDSLGVHLHCYQKEGPIIKLWLAKRAPTKSHHANMLDPNVTKEAYEEAGVPSEWIRKANPKFSDLTHDPITINTSKADGSCMKHSIYYSCDLEVPRSWRPRAVDGEVEEFLSYTMNELEHELRYGTAVRPSMVAVLVDFMIRHGQLKMGNDDEEILRKAMRNERLSLF